MVNYLVPLLYYFGHDSYLIYGFELEISMSDGGVFLIWAGDVLSGTSSNGMHHAGILEEWFGFHWWNGRVPILVLTIVLILAPLVSFKRVGKSALLILISIF